MPSQPNTMTSDGKNKVEGCRLDDPLHVDTQWGVTYEIKDHQNKGAFFKLRQKHEECFAHYMDSPLKNPSMLEKCFVFCPVVTSFNAP